MKRSYASVAQLLALGAVGAFLLTRKPFRNHLHPGQVAIITGGSRGLGRAMAHRFGKAGLKLVLVARSLDELESARDELIARGAITNAESVLLYPCDLRDAANAERLVDAAMQRFGRLDILINNAGIIVVGPAENQSLDAYRQAMEVDFFAALNCIHASLPFFLKQQSGGIVNIASIGGKFAMPHLLPYVAAKFALVGFSEGLHAELRNRGVRVTTVCPGLMRTGGEAHAQFRGQVEKEKAWFQLAARTPLVSANVAHAADKIFRAVNEGRAEITIAPQAWLAARFAGLAPETTQLAASLVHAYLLPSPATELHTSPARA